MHVPGRGHGISLRDSPATCLASLTFGSDPKPSRPILPPGKGGSFSRTRSSPRLEEEPSLARFPPRQGGGSFSLPSPLREGSCPVPGSALPIGDAADADVELVAGMTRASFLDAFQEMVRGQGTPP
jgi:hypothetical protein